MDRLDQYREILYKILAKYTPLMSKPARAADQQENCITSTVIVSEDRNHFMVINEGWDGKRRIHSLIFHAGVANSGSITMASIGVLLKNSLLQAFLKTRLCLHFIHSMFGNIQAMRWLRYLEWVVLVCGEVGDRPPNLVVAVIAVERWLRMIRAIVAHHCPHQPSSES
jgi:XisI protein